MSAEQIEMNEALYRYMLSVSSREDDLLRRLREETARDPMAIMQISPPMGQFMALLTELLGVRRAIEVGVFTGYSSLSVARALPQDGKLVALDVSDEWTRMARRYWAEAGVADRIDLRLGPGGDSLKAMLAAGEAGTYDLMFIDADKEGYDTYYELGLQLLRPGGLIMLDNMLYFGKLMSDPPDGTSDGQRKNIAALRALNTKLHRDERVTLAMLPLGDGVMLCRKR